MNRLLSWYYTALLIPALFCGCESSEKNKQKLQESYIEDQISSNKVDQKTKEGKPRGEESENSIDTVITVQKDIDQEKVKQEDKKQTKPKRIYYAAMSFDSAIHHLPAISEGEKFEDRFSFKNTGDVALTIKNASASCGCTQPSYPFIDIQPGEEGYIGVDYNSVGKEGPQVAEISIYANTYPGKTVLQMKFDVLPKEAENAEEKLD